MCGNEKRDNGQNDLSLSLNCVGISGKLKLKQFLLVCEKPVGRKPQSVNNQNEAK